MKGQVKLHVHVNSDHTKKNKIKKECSHVFCKSDYLVNVSLV